MPGEAYQVHDHMMAVVKAVEQLHQAIRQLQEDWDDVQMRPYLKAQPAKVALATSTLGFEQSRLLLLFRRINKPSETVVVQGPQLRLVR